MEKETPIFELKDISYSYPNKLALSHINIQIYKGDFLAIVGPNGSGKSTLLKLILGLLPLQKGDILISGKKINQYKSWEKISYVSQKSNAFSSGFPATVKEVVMSGLTKNKSLFKWFNKEDAAQVDAILERLNISDLKNENIAQLSGGQQQRTFIARALISKPSILILDEPTVGIDARHVSEFYQLLTQLKQEGITIILVTHDIGVVADTASKVACLNQHIHFHGTSESFKSLDEVSISKIYGHPVQFVDHQHDRDCCAHEEVEELVQS
ncbi:MULTISPECIES: metal ABC transporter ATP-binding protein [Mammaliicoccus]|uniref:Metal ABC transporter ATP-binding protein n=3 Tax=Mammaliicoccus sciuri TaxID=1296 RepID=A0AAJ4SGY9_MAMSC|nr:MULTISPECIES: metal ABC transporter ATP-binding protein [Mammaliicoccus]MBF9296947.1 metal ABC transporter ATP-binding protein [Staphylococcus schleiferi]MBN4908664.1 metal ABC transporter ATP-binding protein [Staphylococcus sp. EG-SA-13]ARB40617.1 zinc ABC transporter ATP-binding protein [Mammaliicoccus sciuri]MCD3218357.1 metal ABC transporter ATP-binding protein [Mammaliicoccus sciuri]MCD8797976.1 metal ABC transporter ATP-binding protein [Mammaliicoccus sciuri]